MSGLPAESHHHRACHLAEIALEQTWYYSYTVIKAPYLCNGPSGALSGNRFEIVLRNIEPADADQVSAAAIALRNSGFLNYYGLQRFGSGAPTHR